MDQDKSKQNQSSGQEPVQPQLSQGSVTIAGEKININSQAVPSSPGTPSEVIEGLKEASEKGIFPQPPNSDE